MERTGAVNRGRPCFTAGLCRKCYQKDEWWWLWEGI